jgi:hypothetical protein
LKTPVKHSKEEQVMSKPTPNWMQYALDALQIEEYIAKYVLSFHRSWLRDWQAPGLIHGTLLTAQIRRAAGIEADGDDLIHKIKVAFVDQMTQE